MVTILVHFPASHNYHHLLSCLLMFFGSIWTQYFAYTVMPGASYVLWTNSSLMRTNVNTSAVCLFEMVHYAPFNTCSVMSGSFLCLNRYLTEDKVSCSRKQCSVSGETRTSDPSISSRAFYK